MANQLIETFIQKNGPRKGQNYTVKRGKSGQAIRVYESGDTALAGKPIPVSSSVNAKRRPARIR